MKKNGNRAASAERGARTGLGLTREARQECARMLNVLLADEFALYVKTRKFHWNVRGPRFHDLHAFFEKQYEELDAFLDEVAERVATLGGEAFGTLLEFSETTRIEERPGERSEPDGMVEELLRDHESVIRSIRAAVDDCQDRFHDEATAHFLTELLFKHEKMSWMLRALLARES